MKVTLSFNTTYSAYLFYMYGCYSIQHGNVSHYCEIQQIVVINVKVPLSNANIVKQNLLKYLGDVCLKYL